MSDQRVNGLGGVFFKAKDPVNLAKWYANHLGMNLETAAPEEDAGGAVSAVFQWRETDEPDKMGSTVWALFPRDTDYFGGSDFMINYRVADLDAVLSALASEGVWIDPRREDQPYGRFAWIKDAEGNRIELWQPIEE